MHTSRLHVPGACTETGYTRSFSTTHDILKNGLIGRITPIKASAVLVKEHVGRASVVVASGPGTRAAFRCARLPAGENFHGHAELGQK
ncbi:hypothetical protein [Agrobacterium tumefaciens]|uniref:hypothetical protein n=1 Tax=Agrobacterium tumefaciens TaxID=358 RepID=UPI0021D19175|nr:hypothetical protein [Agrobacterium tumefaciens]UXS23074.1 hypothetical protein FY153_00900 [Agrobacterium tumefaciens]